MEQKLQTTLAEKVSPLHECAVCRGDVGHADARAAKCPAAHARLTFDKEAERELRKRQLWAGRRAFERQVEAMRRLSRMLHRHGGEVDRRWPYALTRLAEAVQVGQREQENAATFKRTSELRARTQGA